MAAAFAAALAQARTVISNLAPTTATPTAAFTAADGLLSIEQEPPAASDRVFSVEAGNIGELGPRWGDGWEEHRAEFLVTVRYAARGATDASAGNIATATDRMAEDADQIVKALCTRANFATATEIVLHTGGSFDRADPEFPTLKLTFRVHYRVAI